jgi:hypothetical protein
MSVLDSKGREPRKGQRPTFNLKRQRFQQSQVVQEGRGPPAAQSKKHHLYKGTEHISMTIFRAWENSAARRHISFNLAIADVEQLWVRQNGHCAVTGRAMTFATNDWNKVSLDRVDSGGDYSCGNVRLVCSVANIVRNELTDAELQQVLRDKEYIDGLRRSYGSNWYARMKRQEYKRVFGADPPGRETSPLAAKS